MLHNILTKIGIIAVLFTLVSCSAVALPASEPEPTVTSSGKGTIVLGKVSDKPAEKIEEYQPIANYLAVNLGNFGIDSGIVKVAPDLETMTDWLESGEVDLFFDNPYAALFTSDQSGGQPILVRVKEGEEEKYAVFFTVADSDITTLDDLTGRVIALEEPDSASGYMLPLVHLLETGMNPVAVTDPKQAVAADEIGYAFSLDDDNTVQWVFNNEVIAGSVDNDAFAEYSEESPDTLVALAETEPVLCHQLTVVRPGMEPALQENIKTLLLNLDSAEEADTILSPSETERFETLEEEWGAEVVRSQEMYAKMKGFLSAGSKN